MQNVAIIRQSKSLSINQAELPRLPLEFFIGIGIFGVQCKAKANICAFCAEQHPSDQCFQAIKAGKTVVRKCANCQGNHQATSKNCIKFLIANGQAPSTPPVVNPWQNRPKPDAATNAAQSQPARHARPTPSIYEPRAPYLNGRQRCQMALVAYRINQSLTKHHRNRICPNDIARQIFYGKTRYPPRRNPGHTMTGIMCMIGNI